MRVRLLEYQWLRLMICSFYLAYRQFQRNQIYSTQKAKCLTSMQGLLLGNENMAAQYPYAKQNRKIVVNTSSTNERNTGEKGKQQSASKKPNSCWKVRHISKFKLIFFRQLSTASHYSNDFQNYKYWCLFTILKIIDSQWNKSFQNFISFIRTKITKNITAELLSVNFLNHFLLYRDHLMRIKEEYQFKRVIKTA